MIHRAFERIVLTVWLIAITAAAPAARAAEHDLILGIFPRYKATQITTMYAPLADYLSERLGRKVILITSKDFNSFWEGVTQRRYDIVHYNQYHYIRSARNYRVVAHSQEFGKDAVAGALYVRRDSGITEISQLRGRTIIFGGGRDAMLSYIAPRYLLARAGLKEGDFKTEIAVNPPNALLALYHKQADAAGGGDILIDLPVVKNAIDARELRILAATEPLLFLPWAVKRTMPAKLRLSIQAILVDLEQSDAGRKVLKAAETTKLGKADDRDYDPARRMTSAVFGPEGGAGQKLRPAP
ncbi:MAG TPA: PhnD/SsuA/transferrin family substrate-binding protein [Burkholderiales bacterium]|nr:PhnD/SsuA/transferrin family substrate-binding protein [Burkholderiales bacterium]